MLGLQSAVVALASYTIKIHFPWGPIFESFSKPILRIFFHLTSVHSTVLSIKKNRPKEYLKKRQVFQCVSKLRVLQNQNKRLCCWHTGSLPCPGQTFHRAMMTPGPLCTVAKEGTTNPHLLMAFHHMEVNPSLVLTLEPSHRHLTLASPLDPTLGSLEDTQMLVLCQGRGIHLMGCLPCPTSYLQPCLAQVRFIVFHSLTPCFLCSRCFQLVQSSCASEIQSSLQRTWHA